MVIEFYGIKRTSNVNQVMSYTEIRLELNFENKLFYKQN